MGVCNACEKNRFLTFWDSIIEPVDFKLSLTVDNFFSDKKRKIENSFWNTSYENKLSKVVKLTEIWVMDALNHEEENDNVFCGNAQILSEICQISRKKI